MLKTTYSSYPHHPPCFTWSPIFSSSILASICWTPSTSPTVCSSSLPSSLKSSWTTVIKLVFLLQMAHRLNTKHRQACLSHLHMVICIRQTNSETPIMSKGTRERHGRCELVLVSVLVLLLTMLILASLALISSIMESALPWISVIASTIPPRVSSNSTFHQIYLKICESFKCKALKIWVIASTIPSSFTSNSTFQKFHKVLTVHFVLKTEKNSTLISCSVACPGVEHVSRRMSPHMMFKLQHWLPHIVLCQKFRWSKQFDKKAALCMLVSEPCYCHHKCYGLVTANHLFTFSYSCTKQHSRWQNVEFISKVGDPDFWTWILVDDNCFWTLTLHSENGKMLGSSPIHTCLFSGLQIRCYSLPHLINMHILHSPTLVTVVIQKDFVSLSLDTIMVSSTYPPHQWVITLNCWSHC